MTPDLPHRPKSINKSLKWLALLGGGVGSSLPGIAYWRESAPPFLAAWSWLVTGVAVAVLVYGYFKPLVAPQTIPRIALRYIIAALVLVTLYGVLLRYTTVQHSKREGPRYQVGFHTFDWSLKEPQAIRGLSKEVGKDLTAEELMMAYGAFKPGGPEKVWKFWTIIVAGVLLVIVFVSGFISWTYGFAILARYLSAG